MRVFFTALSLSFFSCQVNDNPSRKAIKPAATDTIYSSLEHHYVKDGLFITSRGDLGIRTLEKIGEDTLLETFITRVYNGKEEVDGGPQYLKNALDTSTFQALKDGYFKDKANVYFL